jgi:hypothetical protein
LISNKANNTPKQAVAQQPVFLYQKSRFSNATITKPEVVAGIIADCEKEGKNPQNKTFVL